MTVGTDRSRAPQSGDCTRSSARRWRGGVHPWRGVRLEGPDSESCNSESVHRVCAQLELGWTVEIGQRRRAHLLVHRRSTGHSTGGFYQICVYGMHTLWSPRFVTTRPSFACRSYPLHGGGDLDGPACALTVDGACRAGPHGRVASRQSSPHLLGGRSSNAAGSRYCGSSRLFACVV